VARGRLFAARNRRRSGALPAGEESSACAVANQRGEHCCFPPFLSPAWLPIPSWQDFRTFLRLPATLERNSVPEGKVG
jgi:hypothetical protein